MINFLRALPACLSSFHRTALFVTWVVMVGILRPLILRRLLSKAGHAANNIRVPNKRPQSCLGGIQWLLTNILTVVFSWFCSFIQCFQLQTSKVSANSNSGNMHFLSAGRHLVCCWLLSHKLMKYFAIVSAKLQRYLWHPSVAHSKPMSVNFHVGELACPYSSPALKVGYSSYILYYYID